MPDVVLPALNEAAAIEWVLRRIPVGYHAIVVDNGSTDATAAIAVANGAQVISEPRRGFGAACYTGLCAATADIVCFMDCDGSLDPDALPLLVGHVERGDADLMIGARAARKGAWPVHARLANRVLASEIRRRTGLDIRDLGPMRATRRQALLELDLRDRRSGWPLEMVLRAHRAGWTVRDTAIEYLPRAGRSKVTGTIGGTVRAIKDMRRLLHDDGRS